jgi:hypothetical protein
MGGREMETGWDLPNPEQNTFSSVKLSPVQEIVAEFASSCSNLFYHGILDDLEIEKMLRWVNAAQSCSNEWPISELIPIVTGIISDYSVLIDERRCIYRLIRESLAPSIYHYRYKKYLNNNVASICFKDRKFLFIGNLLVGDIKTAKEAVEIRGGKCVATATMDLDYLIAGQILPTVDSIKAIQILYRIIENRFMDASTLVVGEDDFVNAVLGSKPN